MLAGVVILALVVALMGLNKKKGRGVAGRSAPPPKVTAAAAGAAGDDATTPLLEAAEVRWAAAGWMLGFPPGCLPSSLHMAVVPPAWTLRGGRCAIVWAPAGLHAAMPCQLKHRQQAPLLPAAVQRTNPAWLFVCICRRARHTL